MQQTVVQFHLFWREAGGDFKLEVFRAENFQNARSFAERFLGEKGAAEAYLTADIGAWFKRDTQGRLYLKEITAPAWKPTGTN